MKTSVDFQAMIHAFTEARRMIKVAEKKMRRAAHHHSKVGLDYGMAALDEAAQMLGRVKGIVMEAYDNPHAPRPEAPTRQWWPHYPAFLASAFWKELRARALARAGNRCQACNGGGQLNVHHRTYDKGWGNETLDDVTVLCSVCHMKFHDK